MDGFECKEKNFELDSGSNREPVELLKGRGDVMEGGSSRNDTGS